MTNVGITIDKGHEALVYSPICSYCKYLSLEKRKTCAAFPNGIPDFIWVGRKDHEKPCSGDRGIQFEKAQDEGSSRLPNRF